MGPILLKKIIQELNAEIRGSVISKVHQSGDRLLILKLFIRGVEKRLLISTDPIEPRVHLTEKKYLNPARPLRFCAYLRKHITNSIVEELHMKEGERIAEITLRKKDDKGKIETVTLVIELTGKSANIILVDSKRVVMDALKYYVAEKSPRAVSPGLPLMPLIGKPTAKERSIDKSCETWNESADLYYSESYEKREKTHIENDLRRVVKRVEKRLLRKIGNLANDIERAERSIEKTKEAELLLANFKRITRGMTEIEVGDYFESPPKLTVIKLDPTLSPNENIDKLYKRAKKAKRTVELSSKRVPKIKEELEYLQNLYFSIEEAVDESELNLVRDELIKAGYIKEKPKEKSPKKVLKKKTDEPIEKISIEDGAVIMIGLSGIGNDLIVKKYAHADDLWFHAQNSPGAHVLLKPAKPGKHTETAITEAARYAAGQSKVSTSAKVEVIMAKAGDVRKPKGAKPGMVTVAKYKAIMVEPKRIERGR